MIARGFFRFPTFLLTKILRKGNVYNILKCFRIEYVSNIIVFFFQIFKEIAQKIKGTQKKSGQPTWLSALSLALQCSIFQDL